MESIDLQRVLGFAVALMHCPVEELGSLLYQYPVGALRGSGLSESSPGPLPFFYLNSSREPPVIWLEIVVAGGSYVLRDTCRPVRVVAV